MFNFFKGQHVICSNLPILQILKLSTEKSNSEVTEDLGQEIIKMIKIDHVWITDSNEIAKTLELTMQSPFTR